MDSGSDASEPAALQSARHVGVALGVVVGCLAYVAAHAASAPSPKYLPETGHWAFEVPAGRIAMSYYGLLLWGAAGFLVGVGAAAIPAVSRSLAAPPAARLLHRGGVLVVVAAVVYFAVVELSRWAK
jgi:hypothetical protein